MLLRRTAFLLVVVASGWPGPAEAQVIAPAGRTLFNRSIMLRSLVRLDRFDEVAGRRPRRLVHRTALIWGTTPRLSLSLTMPFVVARGHDARDGMLEGTTSGTGDSTVFARYEVARRNVPAGTTRLSPEVGVTLPTGGAFGSGSTGYSGALIFSRVRDPHWLVTDARFSYRTRGDDGVRPGNRSRYDLAYLYRALPREGLGSPGLLLVLELNAEARRRARAGGDRIADTGGAVVYLSPGVEIFVSRRVVLEVSLPLRVAEDLNGSQNEPKTSLLAGVRWLR